MPPGPACKYVRSITMNSVTNGHAESEAWQRQFLEQGGQGEGEELDAYGDDTALGLGASVMEEDDDVVLDLAIPMTAEVLMTLVTHGVRELGEIETEPQAEQVSGAVELHPMLSLAWDDAVDLLEHVREAEQQRLAEEQELARMSLANDTGGVEEEGAEEEAEEEEKEEGEEEENEQGNEQGGGGGGVEKKAGRSKEREAKRRHGGESKSVQDNHDGTEAVGPADHHVGDEGGDHGDDEEEDEELIPVVTIDAAVFGPNAPAVLAPLRTKFGRCSRL